MGWRAVPFLNPFSWFSKRVAADNVTGKASFTAVERRHVFAAQRQYRSFSQLERRHVFTSK